MCGFHLPSSTAEHLISEFIDFKDFGVATLSSNAARRYDDGCHVSRPRCFWHALSWLRIPTRPLQVLPEGRHMYASCDAYDVAFGAACRRARLVAFLSLSESYHIA